MDEKIAERFLIVGLNWIGDAVMSMPAVQQLRKAHPDTHLTMLVKPGLKALWAMHAAPDEVLVQDGTARTVKMLRQSHYDRAYIFPNSFRSAWLPYCAGVPRRIGARGKWRRLLLSEIVHVGEGHQQFEYMNILGLRGETGAPQISVPHDRFHSLERKLFHALEPGAQSAAVFRSLEARVAACCQSGDSELCDGGLPVITLLPGAARGPSKRWPPEHFIALAQKLRSSLGALILLGGGPDDAASCEEMAKAIGPDVLNMAGRTSIPEWAALLNISDCVVANDSGGMHLATAVGTPVVGIYGITDPGKTGPLGESVVLQKSETQSRDIKKDSEEAVRALAAVTPDEVYMAVKQLLASASPLSSEG